MRKILIKLFHDYVLYLDFFTLFPISDVFLVFILFNCKFKKSLDSIVRKTMTVHYFCGQLILKVITSEGIFNLSLNFSTLDLPPNSLHFLCVKQGMYIESRATYLPDKSAVGFKKSDFKRLI